jgi:hypothetical protein
MGLTIEFAGITTLLWHKDRKEATVVLVDLAAAGFHKHHAAMAMEGGHEVSCPDPDLSIAVPGQELELGIWNLQGTDIELIADGGPLEVDDTEVDVTQAPADNASSIQWLPEIGALCQSRTLAPGVPISARMQLKTGNITSTRAGHELIRVVFDDDDRQVGDERYILPRFLVRIDSPRVKIRLDTNREFKFETDHHVTISNTCVCEPVSRGAPGHFYGHYLLVEAKRKPRIRRTYRSGRPKGATFAWPADPEYCFSAYALI